jgi:TM2 domain-containing membrane protein YozV
MYCKNCGKEVADNAFVCVNCGVLIKEGARFCQVCGAESNPNALFCIKCGARLGSQLLRSKIVAGVLGIVLGGFGVHRFYLGYTGIGIIQLIVTIITCGVGALWGFIEGILILCDVINRDADGKPLSPF